MITVEAKGLDTLVGKMRLLPDKFRAELNKRLAVQALLLVNHIKQDKLSGQVLHVKSGDLRDSIFQENVQNDASGVTYKVASGGNLRYAAIHEFGGTIKHPGSDKLQVFDVGGRTVFTHHTAPHDIPMPQRSYMRTALADNKAQIVAAIQGSLKGAWGA